MLQYGLLSDLPKRRRRRQLAQRQRGLRDRPNPSEPCGPPCRGTRSKVPVSITTVGTLRRSRSSNAAEVSPWVGGRRRFTPTSTPPASAWNSAAEVRPRNLMRSERPSRALPRAGRSPPAQSPPTKISNAPGNLAETSAKASMDVNVHSLRRQRAEGAKDQGVGRQAKPPTGRRRGLESRPIDVGPQGDDRHLGK